MLSIRDKNLFSFLLVLRSPITSDKNIISNKYHTNLKLNKVCL